MKITTINTIDEMDMIIHGEVPETPTIRLCVSDESIGNSERGGHAVLEFSMESGLMHAHLDADDGDVRLTDQGLVNVQLLIEGDWGVTGLVCSLVTLGQKLSQEPSVLAAMAEQLEQERKWRDEHPEILPQN